MSLFAVGTMTLKYKRNHLPRAVKGSWPNAICALLLVLTAFSGTLVNNPSILPGWLMYFAVTLMCVLYMFVRVQLFKFIHFFGKKLLRACGCGDENSAFLQDIAFLIQEANSQPVAFFAKRPSLSTMNKAVQYVRDNEQCAWIRVIHCYEDDSHNADELDLFRKHVATLDEMYPKIKIDLLLVHGKFCPAQMAFLQEELAIPRNLMFMCCPKAGFSYKLGVLGGVRLITH